MVAQFDQTKTSATFQVQASFDKKLHHWQRENAVLGANGWTGRAVDIDQSNLGMSLSHQVFKLGLQCLTHAALRSTKKQKSCLGRFQVFKLLIGEVVLHSGSDYKLRPSHLFNVHRA